MKDSGLIDYWYSKYQPDLEQKCGRKLGTKAGFNPVTMTDFVGIFLLLCFGLVTATLTLASEILMKTILNIRTEMISGGNNQGNITADRSSGSSFITILLDKFEELKGSWSAPPDKNDSSLSLSQGQ